MIIYNKQIEQDYLNILQYCNEVTKALGAEDVPINTEELAQICIDIRQNFPHTDGLAKASAFKKVANFVSHFLAYRPIKAAIRAISDVSLEKADINAVVAFDIAIGCLQHSKIVKGAEVELVVDQPLYVSGHSYRDIIEALSVTTVSPKNHYQLLAVFFEQLVYKTNGHCEYKETPSLSTPYSKPFDASGGDDLSGL